MDREFFLVYVTGPNRWKLLEEYWIALLIVRWTNGIKICQNHFSFLFFYTSADQRTPTLFCIQWKIHWSIRLENVYNIYVYSILYVLQMKIIHLSWNLDSTFSLNSYALQNSAVTHTYRNHLVNIIQRNSDTSIHICLYEERAHVYRVIMMLSPIVEHRSYSSPPIWIKDTVNIVYNSLEISRIKPQYAVFDWILPVDQFIGRGR